jgi:hypothetical protein
MALVNELGAHVREMLTTRYGSMAVAAERLEFSYERLKKAVQRNRFSAQDLDVLFPGKSVDDLKEQFDFNFARRGDLSTAIGDARFNLFKLIETGFRSFQKGAREIDFSLFVRDLYDNLGTGPTKSADAMTLFCDRRSQPIEWSGDQVALMNKLAFALSSGASIIYVMEADLFGAVRPEGQEEDTVDQYFKRYLARLDMFRDEGEPASSFIALVRVRRCPFCMPYQKPALFSCLTEGDGDPNHHHALTTVEVPEQSGGSGFLGTAVLPQREEMANAMRDFLIDLALELREGDPPPKRDFRFIASHKKGERADLEMMISELERISNYQ